MAKKPSAKSVLRNIRKAEPKTPITDEMFLPNLSGIANHPEAKGAFVQKAGDIMTGDLTMTNNSDIIGDGVLDIYTSTGKSIGLRIDDDGTNLTLAGLGTSTIEIEDDVDLLTNDLTTTGDLSAGNISVAEGDDLQIGSTTAFPTTSIIKFGDSDFATIDESSDDVIRLRGRAGVELDVSVGSIKFKMNDEDLTLSSDFGNRWDWGSTTGVTDMNFGSFDIETDTGDITTGTGNITAFNGNVGTATGSLIASTMNISAGSITDANGTISFGNENLTTTGDVNIDSDSSALYLGAGQDVKHVYDGTDYHIYPQQQGTGDTFLHIDDSQGTKIQFEDAGTDKIKINFIEVTTPIVSLFYDGTGAGDTNEFVIRRELATAKDLLNITMGGDFDFNAGDMTTTGDVTLGGDLTFTGATDGLPYGSLYIHEEAYTIPLTQNVYTPIASGSTIWTQGPVNNTTTNTSSGSLIIGKAGIYKIDWSVSAEAETSSLEADIDVFVNEVEQHDGAAHRVFGAANDIGNMGATALLDLAANDIITLRVKNTANNNDITIYDANINIVQVGGT